MDQPRLRLRDRVARIRTEMTLERGAVGGLIGVLLVLAALTTWTVLKSYGEGDAYAADAAQLAGYQDASGALNSLDRLEDQYEEQPSTEVRARVNLAEATLVGGLETLRAGNPDHELADRIEDQGLRALALMRQQFNAEDAGAGERAERIEGRGTALLEGLSHRLDLASQARLATAQRQVTEEQTEQVPLLWVTLGIAALALIFAALAARFLRVRRRAAVAAAEDAQRTKDEFMALISHELRTPLTSIVGYSELLSESSPEEFATSGKGFAEIISRNAGRELRLVEDLLDLTQLDAGKFRVDLREAELPQIVNDSVESARLKAAEKDITISAEVASVPACPGDAQRLAQTCDNLISNAIKFTPAGGTVAVDLHLEGDTAVVTVEDSGIGIPADELEEVFKRMFRTKKAESIAGSGLGLAITKAIVDAHGGEIAVTSEEDKGSIFTMRMPMGPSLAAA
jgi:signal transduction histidine kinase